MLTTSSSRSCSASASLPPSSSPLPSAGAGSTTSPTRLPAPFPRAPPAPPPRLLRQPLGNTDHPVLRPDAASASRVPVCHPPRKLQLGHLLERQCVDLHKRLSERQRPHPEPGRNESTTGVHNLLCADKGMATVPRFQPPQPQDGSFYTSQKILSKEEEGGGLSYLNVLMQSTAERKNAAQVYMLQDCVWCMHNLTIDQIPHTLLEPKSVLVDNKIYMPAAEREVVVLDLTASNFATIQLPQGVEYGPRNTMFSRAEDAAAIYLVHVKKLKVSVWLHNGDGWLLVDTICLLEICSSLTMLDLNASPRLRHVGENAEFVFLEMSQCTLYLDVKCRTMRKVYEMTDMYQFHADIHPFMMIWPPTFPVLKDGLTRNAM